MTGYLHYIPIFSQTFIHIFSILNYHRKKYDIRQKGSIHMRYKTHGTCSSFIDIELKDGVIDSVQFMGGCSGNLQGIAALVKGMTPEEAISKLKGIRCGFKSTSCPDQLAIALEQMTEA